MVNVGFWELHRWTLLFDDLGKPPPDPPVLPENYIKDFTVSTRKMLKRLRKLFDTSRIRWRQIHTTVQYNDKAGNVSRAGVWIHPVKVHHLDEVTKSALKDVNREATGNGEEIKMWPIGDIIAPWPKSWLKDGLHPKEEFSATLWGEGVLEYLART
jgi:hypothetical protein